MFFPHTMTKDKCTSYMHPALSIRKLVTVPSSGDKHLLKPSVQPEILLKLAYPSS